MEWTAVKRLASSRFAQLLAIVPVIGWLLVLNDQFAAVLARLTGLQQLAAPGWQIYAFHAGLSLFGLGVLLYQLVAPKDVSLYVSVDDFVDRQMSLMTRSRYEVFRKDAGQVEIEEERSSLTGDQNSRDLWLSKNRGNVITVLDGYYHQQNRHTRQCLAWACMALLVAGALIASLPSLTTLCWSAARLFELVWR